MRISRAALFSCILGAILLAACQEAAPSSNVIGATVTPIGVAAAAATASPTAAAKSNTPVAPPTAQTVQAAQAAYCKNAGAVTVNANDPLAAKVNGQPIPLALYQRQTAQEQAALIAQGLDPKSQNGQDALKGLQQQVLGQLIDDVLVEQAAKEEKVTVSDQDVNTRVQQMITDAGGNDKFNEYLKSTQMGIDDLCTQLRASIYGEIMLTRETATMPTKVEQVHVAQILLNTQADADKVLAELKAGKSFADMAKQYSQDQATKDNGGDLGWLPKGAMPPEFEAVSFQLKPGETSGVISTALGFHIIQVLAHEQAHELSPEMLQSQKQQAFLAWLDARRNQAKIEKLINP